MPEPPQPQPQQKPPMDVAAFVLAHKKGATGPGGYEVLTGPAAYARVDDLDFWLEFDTKEDAERERAHYVSQAADEMLQGPQAPQPHSRQRQLRARMPKAQRRR